MIFGPNPSHSSAPSWRPLKMSLNGLIGSAESSSSLSRPGSPPQQTDEGLGGSRTSFDSERSGASSPPNISGEPINGAVNGRKHANSDPILRLQEELERTKEEKETLTAQYRNLLGKLTTMRTTLGNKLQQDAVRLTDAVLSLLLFLCVCMAMQEELDRREQIVQQLTAQNDDLSATVETLKKELIASHQDAERASAELDAMRARAYQENAQESMRRERELRETQSELERLRLERDEWERMALQERVLADETKVAAETYKRELELEREARARDQAELELELERSTNLQSVLEDFQAGQSPHFSRSRCVRKGNDVWNVAKEHELRQAVEDYQSQLTQTTQSLAEYKHRALTAEVTIRTALR